MNEYIIEKYNYSKRQLLIKLKYKVPDKLTFIELKEEMIKQYPNEFKNDDIIETNGFIPSMEKIIPKNVNTIKFIQNFDNESYNDNNYIEQNEENENNEENEDDSFDSYGNTLDDLLNKSEKKNQNIMNKKRNRNEESMDNVIELDENYEIISDFAPTRKELFEKLFNQDFSEKLDYSKNKAKIHFNPEKYAKINNLNKFFFDGEELIDSVVNREIEFNEDNKSLLLNNKIKIEQVNQKQNLIIEKETHNESHKNKNSIEIKQEKKIRKEIINEIKNEKPIKGNLIKNEIKKKNINEIKNEKIIKEKNINIIKDLNKKEAINETKKVQQLKQEELFNKKKISKEKEIEEENGFEFYDLYGDLNRKGIKEYLLELYNLKYPNYKQRIKYGKLIYQISQLCPQRKEKQLNFVFDLDSTLICARVLEFYKLNEVKEKYKSLGEYYQFIELYNSAFQIQNLIVNYRSGIKSMFNKIKNISNLYIYTLSFGNYAETIKNYIEQLCKVKFEKIFYFIPNQNEKRMKFFRKLNLSHFNTLILDDLEYVWFDEIIRHKCIINSMSYCCDKTYIIANQTFLENRNKGINPPFFLI